MGQDLLIMAMLLYRVRWYLYVCLTTLLTVISQCWSHRGSVTTITQAKAMFLRLRYYQRTLCPNVGALALSEQAA